MRNVVDMHKKCEYNYQYRRREVICLKNTYQKLVDDRCVNMAELSKKTKIPKSTLYKKFSGKVKFYIDDLKKITKALHLSDEEIIKYFF